MSVDWDVADWGGRVHLGMTVADSHTTTEDAAEAGRG